MRIAVVGLIGAMVVSGEQPAACGGGGEGPAVVELHLPSGPGRTSFEWVGCGDWGLSQDGRVGADGARILVEEGWARCAVRAVREDGQLRVVSSMVPLTGDTQAITFDLEGGAIGGMGAEIAHFGLYVRIRYVVPGSPAHVLGPQEGDRVTAVDGVPVRELSTEAFIREVTGPPGTTVHLEVRAPGCHAEAERFHLVRERVP